MRLDCLPKEASASRQSAKILTVPATSQTVHRAGLHPNPPPQTGTPKRRRATSDETGTPPQKPTRTTPPTQSAPASKQSPPPNKPSGDKRMKKSANREADEEEHKQNPTQAKTENDGLTKANNPQRQRASKRTTTKQVNKPTKRGANNDSMRTQTERVRERDKHTHTRQAPESKHARDDRRDWQKRQPKGHTACGAALLGHFPAEARNSCI